MTAIAQQLDDLLSRLDPQRARHLESLVRDALVLAGETTNGQPAWPPGYFEQTAGAFAGELFDRPPQGELPDHDVW